MQSVRAQRGKCPIEDHDDGARRWCSRCCLFSFWHHAEPEVALCDQMAVGESIFDRYTIHFAPINPLFSSVYTTIALGHATATPRTLYVVVATPKMQEGEEEAERARDLGYMLILGSQTFYSGCRDCKPKIIYSNLIAKEKKVNFGMKEAP
ncbi:hypothetical protein DMENIID0001_037760 [Sergentomyia squamirostris]